MSEKDRTIYVSEHLDGEVLHVRVEMPDGRKEYRYAFYLILETDEGLSKEVVWYQPEAATSFELSRNGVYHTVCFVREQGSETVQIHESKQTFCHTSTTSGQRTGSKGCSNISISIFGSCVSRDVLEYWPREQTRPQLKTYIARQSVVSAVSTPIMCRDDEVTLDSAFQKRMVLCDLRKEAFSDLCENRSDYLIVDLIDERFDLILIDGSWATLSNETLESNFFQSRLGIATKKVEGLKRQKDIHGEYRAGDAKIEECVKEFAQRLKNIYPESHIILHEALMKDYYIEENGIRKKFPPEYVSVNRKVNDLLKAMYGWLRQYLPQAHVVNVDERICADAGHKWGLAPMHYQEKYYRRVLEEIIRIIDNQESTAEE